jgi:hypothetical protein
MTSVLRSFAQKNRNTTQIIPTYGGLGDTDFPFDLSGSTYYVLHMPNVNQIGGSYSVDMAGLDGSGNLLNFDGRFYANDIYIYNINFIIDVPIPASSVPNSEFTIYFKNIPYNNFEGPPLLTIGLLSQTDSYPYIMSPPLPSLFGNNQPPSITMKSDGDNWVVVSSGPAGWVGIYLLGTLIGNMNIP